MQLTRLRPALNIAAVGSALLLATAAQADAVYHPVPTEAGAIFHPDAVSQKTSAQVDAELADAMKKPHWFWASKGGPWPATSADKPKSREQVQAELDAAMRDPFWKWASKGAPWPNGAPVVSARR